MAHGCISKAEVRGSITVSAPEGEQAAVDRFLQLGYEQFQGRRIFDGGRSGQRTPEKQKALVPLGTEAFVVDQQRREVG